MMIHNTITSDEKYVHKTVFLEFNKNWLTKEEVDTIWSCFISMSLQTDWVIIIITRFKPDQLKSWIYGIVQKWVYCILLSIKSISFHRRVTVIKCTIDSCLNPPPKIYHCAQVFILFFIFLAKNNNLQINLILK